jgi:inosose dehydratase
MQFNRRNFIGSLTGASLSPFLASFRPALPPKKWPISCNTYNWSTFYTRQGKKWGEDWDACLADFVKAGIPAIEPGFGGPAEVTALAPFLKKYNLLMPSLYVNSSLHKAEEAQKSIANVLATAAEAKKWLGTQLIVTNPNPVRWGNPEAKPDADLIEQAKNLDQLGAELRKRGQVLAYHTHDMELLAGGREFHHSLLNTSPKNVSFCFDTHWVYRGCQNSQVAVFDVLKLYGSRIVELHVRQSVGGVWSETFGPGDIDYQRFARELAALKLNPLIVIEQSVEAKTAHTMDGVEAHQKNLAMIKEVFGVK